MSNDTSWENVHLVIVWYILNFFIPLSTSHFSINSTISPLMIFFLPSSSDPFYSPLSLSCHLLRLRFSGQLQRIPCQTCVLLLMISQECPLRCS